MLLAFLLIVIAVCQNQASNDEQARDILDKALKDKNPDTRKQAVTALSLSGAQQPFLSMLESMVDDKDVEVSLATVASLADPKSNRTLATLRKGLKDEAPEVSFAAAKALWALNDPTGKEALLSVLSGGQDVLRLVHQGEG
jgi:HEAT repeat protein